MEKSLCDDSCHVHAIYMSLSISLTVTVLIILEYTQCRNNSAQISSGYLIMPGTQTLY